MLFLLLLLLSEASGPGAVRAAVRDADRRVRPPLFVETKRTEEESLAFLTGSDLIPLRTPEAAAVRGRGGHRQAILITTVHANMAAI